MQRRAHPKACFFRVPPRHSHGLNRHVLEARFLLAETSLQQNERASEESAMRSGWMRLVRTAAAMLALAGGLWAQGARAAEVKNVTAKYAWPWGVYISYEVSGTIPADVPLFVKAVDRTKNVTY